MASRPKLENLNILYPIIIILVIVLATSAFVIVDSGHVGVVRTLGAVQPQPLPEGFHIKKPFLDKVLSCIYEIEKDTVEIYDKYKVLPEEKRKIIQIIIDSYNPLVDLDELSY